MYYIQIAKFEDRENRKGIDSILSMEYMGASEFEFGALPESLKRIRHSFSEYDYFTYQFTKTDKIVTVFCKKDEEEKVKGIIQELSTKNVRTKGSTQLEDWVYPEKTFRPYNRNDFWWDIDNDFMFWKENEDFTTKFKQQIIIQK